MSKPLPQVTGCTLPVQAVKAFPSGQALWAFPYAKTPRGLRVTPARAYKGPRSDETVSLLLTEDGIVDAAEVEIDETYRLPIRPVLWTRPLPRVTKSYREMMAGFKKAHGLV